ncbi:MAG: radical SAM protein [Thermofilaceae archaeon]
MSYIRPFDPWRKGSLCTCPFKYTVNPYTGCSHACLYCYASSYIRRFFQPRPKVGFLRRSFNDLKRLPPISIINISSSSDPYQPCELEYQYTRHLLEVIAGKHIVEVVTKSDLVVRDIDLLKRGFSIVSVTLTTLDESLAARLEPGAPPSKRRIEAMGKLSRAGIPVVLRLDPLIPGLTDSPDSIREVIEEAVSSGVSHVVSSIYKVKPDNLRRVIEVFPEILPRIRELYFKHGERIHGYLYSERSYRFKTLKVVREEAHRHGLTFASCREGFPELSDPGVSCDGTYLTHASSSFQHTLRSY